jgi:outer membrane immunogenic protein
MKKISTILMFCVITVLLNAQAPLERGGKQFNAGVGLSGWGVPLYIGMDFGTGHNFTVGFEGSFRSYEQNVTGTKYNSSIFGLSGNCNYHFNQVFEIPSNWDFYAGLNLGLYFWSYPSDYPEKHVSNLGLGAQIGGRYFITNKFGLNLELGGGNAFSQGKFGITCKF